MAGARLLSIFATIADGLERGDLSVLPPSVAADVRRELTNVPPDPILPPGRTRPERTDHGRRSHGRRNR